MKQTLQNYLSNRKLIATYSLPEKPDSFEVGFIDEIDDDTIMLEGYADDGSFDGYIILWIKDIYQIEWDSKYVKMISKLLSSDNQNNKLNDLSNHCIADLIRYAQNSNRIITIGLLSRDGKQLMGYIQRITSKTITLRIVNQYGEQDGITIIYLNDCKYLSCGGHEESIVEKLSKLSS